MTNKKSLEETLLESLARINREVETTLNIELTDRDFTDGRDELLHIYCHEACHAALAHCVPWLGELPEGEHTLVDEVLARLLEKEIAPRLGLYLHSNEEFLVELSMYSVEIAQESYERLSAAWDADFWPRHDLAGMAVHALMTLRHGDLIYHILPKADWQVAVENGVYRAASLESQGFIHFSRAEQVLQVAANFYRGQKDLLLLTVAMERLKGEVRYEDLLGEGQLFPHLYGPLNLDAVVGVDQFEADVEGNFQMPQKP